MLRHASALVGLLLVIPKLLSNELKRQNVNLEQDNNFKLFLILQVFNFVQKKKSVNINVAQFVTSCGTDSLT